MWGAHFSAFGIEFDTFKAFTYFAFVVAGAAFRREGLRIGLSYNKFLSVFLIAAVGGPIGGSLLSLLEFQRPLSSFLDGSSGSSHLGGYFVVVPLLILWALWQKVPVLRLLDAVTLPWVAGYALGRLACFFSGDGCYGIETSSFVGMSFPHGRIPTNATVFPAPLFETGYSLIIFIVFYWLYARRGAVFPAGRIFFGASSWMFLSRFAVEFIRTNPKYAGLSLTQWACIPLVLGYSGANSFLFAVEHSFKPNGRDPEVSVA